MGTKKMGAFLMWALKNGGHSVCKNAISRQKFANFPLKLPQNRKISQNAREARKNWQFLCKI